MQNSTVSVSKWLMLLVGLAAVVRLVGLNKWPPSLYWEEVALGYDAFSIFKTGRDHHGNPWPVVAFESFGDWKPALYFYLIIPFLPIFGLSAYAVRLPSAIAGVMTVLLVYFLARELKLNKSVALLSSFVLAILPWHIQFSRAGFEVNVATMWLTLGVLFLLRGRKSGKWIWLGVVAMALSMYTYHGLRLLAPLIGLMVVATYWKKLAAKKEFFLSAGMGLVILLPLIGSISSVQTQQRIRETSLYSVSQAVVNTNRWRGEDGGGLVARVIHHRYWYWGREIVVGVMRHFDLDFLFLKGDDNARHQTGGFALFYHWMIVPYLWGVWEMMRKWDRSSMMMVGWMVLAAVPAALTKTTPHTLRFLPAVVAFSIVVAVGLDKLWRWMSKYKFQSMLKVALITIVGVQMLAYGMDYLVVYPKRYSRHWQYGYEQVMDYIGKVRDDYDKVYFTRDYGRPAMYAMFHWRMDPREVQMIEAQILQDQGELLKLMNVEFDLGNVNTGSLVVTDEEMEGGELLKAISFLDRSGAFYVYKN